MPRGLIDLVAELEPVRIVLGIPLGMDGTEGEMAREARRFGERLGSLTGVPVVEWDEAMTTREARRALIEAGVRRRRRSRRGSDDIMAATILLRSYLESQERR